MGGKSIDWRAWPLGLFPDTVIAENLGVSSAAVFYARASRGLPSARFPKIMETERQWSRWPLGLMTDWVIAENMGVDNSTVAKARKKRGIPAFRRCETPRCDRAIIAPHLGQGKTDKEVANSLGLSVCQVQAARTRAGVRSTRIDWNTAPLGSAPDAEIGKQYGVTHGVVASARWRRGIPKWREERMCACGTRFIAWRREQRFCQKKCSSCWWWAFSKGETAEVCYLIVALRAFRKSIYKKEGKHVA